MIDLTKFIQEETVIMPIINNWGKYNGRKIKVRTEEDGWFKVNIGNTARVISKASPLEVIKSCKKEGGKKGATYQTKVYPLGTEGVAYNFDDFFRRGFGETVNVFFMNTPLFEVVNVIRWEDGRFYYIDRSLTKNRSILKEMKDKFEKNESISDIKGITPELRYYFLLINLQKESYEALKLFEQMKITEEERKRKLKIFNNAFPMRLKDVIVKAGGTYIRHSKQGTGYLVEWSVGNQVVKSTIRDDLRIMSAGFCLSGDDRKHSVASIINLAKLFQQRAPLYITRE